MASAVSAGDGGQSRHDATIISELRTVRARIGAKLSMSITLEEVDALLRAVDERDELRRQTVGDLEAGFPPVRVTSVLPMSEEELPLSIPTAAEWIDAQPKGAGPAMSCPRRDTIHDCPLGGCADTTPRVSEIPDLPTDERDDIGREERETPPREVTHATMCGVGSSGSCFVPWCSCECHVRRSDVALTR